MEYCTAEEMEEDMEKGVKKERNMQPKRKNKTESEKHANLLPFLFQNSGYVAHLSSYIACLDLLNHSSKNNVVHNICKLF